MAEEKGLRQAHLAKAMHRAPGVVAQWWHGKVMPDTESLLALASMFDTTHAALMEEAQRLVDAARGDPPAPGATAKPNALEPAPRPLDLAALDAKIDRHLTNQVDLLKEMRQQLGELFRLVTEAAAPRPAPEPAGDLAEDLPLPRRLVVVRRKQTRRPKGKAH